MRHPLFAMLVSLVASAILIGTPFDLAIAGCVEGDCINGYSVYTWPDGSRYEGEFENNTFTGRGKYTWANGKWYEGEFKNDKRHGRGVYAWPDGKKYTGEFVDGRRHGHGNFSWPDGSSYEGQWVDGQKEGLGTFNWPDGSSYTGEWKDGVKSGYGIYTFPDGKTDAGMWRADELATPMDAAEVSSALEAMRPADEAAAAVTPDPAAAPAPPSPPATPAPAMAAAAPPVEAAPVADAAGSTTAPLVQSPAEASQSGGAGTPAAPISTAVDIAVHTVALVDGYTVIPSVSAPLFSRGDHRRVGEFTLAISEGGDNTAAVNLRVRNESACAMVFDGYLRKSDTYYRVVTWQNGDAISPGVTKTHEADIPLDGSLTSGGLIFKAQGVLGSCPGGS